MNGEDGYTEEEICQIVELLKEKEIYCSPDSAIDCYSCPNDEICQSVFDDFDSKRKSKDA